MATQKQELAVKEISENVGISTRQAMLKAGYSASTALTPQRLTESEGFKQLMDKYMPEELLAKRHLELLNKQEVIVRNNVTTGMIETIPTGEMDVTARKAGLDMAYKLRGLYKDGQPQGNNNINLTFINSTVVQEKVRAFEQDLKEQLINTPLN